MLFFRSAQFIVALALLTIGLAAPAHAQQNKQIISGTWYEDRAVSALNSQIFTFTQVPANQFLNITNVSCQMTTTTQEVVAEVYLVAGTTSGANDLGRPYGLMGSAVPRTLGGNNYYSIVTNQIYFKFGPGRFPSIIMSMVSTGTFAAAGSCVIVGNLSDS
jgi:hypothetical protein